MRNRKFYKSIFLVAALYDFVLGFVFFLFFKNIYSVLVIDLPATPAYLQLSAAFVFVQGLMYYFVYTDLNKNVDIVKVGIVYKIVYAGVAFYYLAVGGLPHPMFALFGLFDIIFIWLFAMYLADYKKVMMKHL